MTTIPITPPARSVLDEAPDNLRAFVESLAGLVGGGANWMVRKKTLCDAMLSLGTYLALTPEQRGALADRVGATPPEKEPGGDPDGAEAPAPFAHLLPLYVGAILERLGEDSLASAEQAAVYVLSVHPEHQAAAEAWMLADPRNARAVRKVVKTDKRLGALLKQARTAGGVPGAGPPMEGETP